MDALKQEIAEWLNGRIGEGPPAVEAREIEIHTISALEWQLRVRTWNQGVRYFGIKLTEHM